MMKPRQNSQPLLQPYWWADGGAPLPYDKTALPSNIDCVIIGAGLTGASAARTIAQNGISVLVLDAQSPGEGASSRNGGMVGGGHRLSLEALQKNFSTHTAIELLREAHCDSGQFVRSLIKQGNIHCQYNDCGRFRGFWNQKQYDATARTIEAMQQYFPLNAEMISQENLHAETSSPCYKSGVVFHDHAAFQPKYFHQGLIQAAEAAGAIIRGHCPVTSVTRKGANFIVTTDEGIIETAQILVATNGYSNNVVAPIHRGIFPIPSFIIATEELSKERMQELFPKGRMMVETYERHGYYRPSPDGKRIILGGRAALTQRDPKYTQYKLIKILHDIYPDLGSVRIDYHWRGNTGFTFDQMPHIGQENGIWYALGFSGNGNTMAPYLGHKVALQMLNKPEGKTAYSTTPLPKPWWYRGTKNATPWFLHLLEPFYRLLDSKEKLLR